MSKKELFNGLKRTLVTFLSVATVISSIPSLGAYASEVVTEEAIVTTETTEESSTVEVITEAVTETNTETAESETDTDVASTEECSSSEETETASEELLLEGAGEYNFIFDSAGVPTSIKEFEVYDGENKLSAEKTGQKYSYAFSGTEGKLTFKIKSFSCYHITNLMIDANTNIAIDSSNISSVNKVQGGGTATLYYSVDIDKSSIVNNMDQPWKLSVYDNGSSDISISPGIYNGIRGLEVRRNGLSQIESIATPEEGFDYKIPTNFGEIIEISYTGSSRALKLYTISGQGDSATTNTIEPTKEGSKYVFTVENDNYDYFSAYIYSDEDEFTSYTVKYAEESKPTVTSGNKKYTYPLNKYVYLISTYGEYIYGTKSGDDLVFSNLRAGNGVDYYLYSAVPDFKVSEAKIGENSADIMYSCYSIVDLKEYTHGSYNIELAMTPETLKKIEFTLTGDVSNAQLNFENPYEYKTLVGTYKKYTYGTSLDFEVQSYDDWTVYPDEIVCTVKCGGETIPKDEAGFYHITGINGDTIVEINAEYPGVEATSFTLDSGEVDKDSFTVCDQSGEKLVVGEGGKYIIPVSTRYIEIKSETDGNSIIDSIEAGIAEACENYYPSYEVKSYGTCAEDTIVSWSIKLPAKDIAGGYAKFNEGFLRKEVPIYGAKNLKFDVSNGYSRLNIEKGWGNYCVLAGIGDDVIVDVKSDKTYTINSIKVYEIGKEKTYKGTVTLDKKTLANSYPNIVVNISRNYILNVYEGENILSEKVALKPNTTYKYELVTTDEYPDISEVQIKKGSELIDTIDGEELSLKNADFDEDFPVSYSFNYKLTDEELFGQNITLVYKTTGENGNEDYSYPLKVASELTSVKIGGKDPSKTTITQQTGSAMEYAVTYNAGVDRYAVSICGGEEINGNGYRLVLSHGATGDKLLVESSLTSENQYLESISDYLCYCGKNIPFTITLSDTAITKATPSAKLESATDTSFTLALGFPKGLVNTDNMYYKVTFEAENAPTGYLSQGSEYIAVDKAASINKTISVVDGLTPGEGSAVKYAVKVSLVLAAPNGEGFTELCTSKSVDVKNVSTIAPAYATKLSLTKKTTTLYANCLETLVAVAKFDKNVSYRRISSVEVIPNDGKVTVATDGEGKNILVGTSEGALGKYTITAVAEGVSAPVTASIVINVKPNVDFSKVNLTVPSNKVYKKKNAALTIKPAISASDYSGKAIKLSNVTYSISNESGSIRNAVDNGFISINSKTGVVSVKKNYLLENDSTLRIKADYSDYTGNSDSKEVRVLLTSVQDEIAYVEVAQINGLDYKKLDVLNKAVTTDKLAGASIVAFNKKGERIDNVTYTVSGKSVTVDKNSGAITTTKKPGKSKITLTTADGGNRKYVFDLETKYYVPEGGIGLYCRKFYDGAFSKLNPSEDYVIPVGQFYIDIRYADNDDAETLYSLFDESAPLVDCSVTYKGVTVIDLYGYNIGIVNGKTGSVTIKSGSVKNEYKFTNDHYSSSASVKLKKTKATVYTGADDENIQEIKLAVTDNDKSKLSPEYYMRVDFGGFQDYAKYGMTLFDVVDSVETCTYSAEDGTITLRIKGDLPKGTYKLDILVYDKNFVDHNDAVALADPIQFTLSVVDLPKATLTPITTYSAKKADTSLLLGINSLKNSTGDWSISAEPAVNYNDKGVVNEFNKYFEVVVQEGVYNLKLKDDCGVDKFEDVPLKDRVGYLTYNYTDLLGNNHIQQVKIAVTVK